MPMNKVRVAVLRGGPSEEYDVSLRTGNSVLRSMDRKLFQPIDVVITKDGEWLVDGSSRYPERVLSMIDIAFLALHGTYGEDGSVQRLLDKHGIKHTGSRAFPSSVAMNKVTTKERLKHLDVLMAPHMVVSRDSLSNVHAISKAIGEMFGPEYVIKPISKGSSIGTIVVKNPALLSSAIEKGLAEFDQLLVEKRILGKEATCGVIENYRNERLYALPPIEIVPPKHADFFDYTVKYDDSTEEICPARFSTDTKKEIELLSRKIHETLDLSQYSRSDFIVGEDGIYFLEVNTLPGLTEQSLFPKAIMAVGGTYEDFITHLLTDRLER